MQKKEIIEGLVKIGLNDKEARVYLSALELGESTAQQIAAKATVNRPSTYIAIEELTQRGMMSSFQKGKKRYFLAGKPSDLEYIVEKEAEAVEKKRNDVIGLVNLLTSFGSQDRSDIIAEVFLGIEGLGVMQRRMLAGALKTKKIDTIASISIAREFIPKKAMAPFWEELDKNKVMVRSLFSGDIHNSHQSKYWTRRKLSKNIIPFKGEISVCGNEVYLLTQELSGVIVINSVIADTFRALFDCAWSANEKYL